MIQDPIVIISAVRTPIASFQGYFKDTTAPELGASVIRAVCEKAQLNPEAVNEVLMGCVLSAGLGQAPARQATLLAGLPHSTAATTLNKVCGSGMKAVMLAHDILAAGSQNIAIAGGMENMTQAPYLLPKARSGYRLGNQTALDHMFCDGLEDAYQKGSLMGEFAEQCAQTHSLSREAQDQYVLKGLERTKAAQATGKFDLEISSVTVDTKEGKKTISTDEGPSSARPEKIPQLKPAFKKEGTITAANSSSIADGAAALLLMRRSEAEKHGLTSLATIVGSATHSQEPAWFTTAPIGAIQKLLSKVQWSKNDVDLYEINEAFAVVAMAAIQALELPSEKVNVHGGACVLGHPIGASGARILVTLIHALHSCGLKRGIAALCIGGGEATAMAITI